MKTLKLPGWLVAGLVLMGAPLAAQDVIVTDPVWADAEKAPAVPPPQFKKKPVVEYPEAMKQADMTGYVIVKPGISTKGVVMNSESMPSEKGFDMAIRRIAFGAGPAEPFFKGVTKEADEQAFWYTVIFNPASADAKAADASARLEAVAPVIVSEELLAGAVKGKKSLQVPGIVKLDALGAVQSVTTEKPEHGVFRDVIAAGLARWKFAPARKAGAPVESELRLVFWLCTALKVVQVPDTMPQLVSQLDVRYPRAMKESGMRGEVVLEFTVNEKGLVENPVVLRSNNPGFNEEAVRAAAKLKFKPAKRAGKPVSSVMKLPIMFNIESR